MKYLKTYETYVNQNFPDLYDGPIGDEEIISIPIDYYRVDYDEDEDELEKEEPNDTNRRTSTRKQSKFKRAKTKISPE